MRPALPDLGRLETTLGYTFRDRALLERAVTHASFAHEVSSRTPPPHNELLEFLGDGALNYLVAEMLFEAFPRESEGTLSRARSHLVSEPHFARLARSIGLGGFLRLAVGEERSGERERDSVLADAFEALFAAVTLDSGLEAARALAQRLFAPELVLLDARDFAEKEPRTALQELAQGEGLPLPRYTLLEESGPDHRKSFVYEVVYDESLRALGAGGSKKEAQREAARAALEQRRARPGQT